MPLIKFLSTQANSLLGMCSFTVRQARSATGATPDAFQVGTGTAGAVGAANCATGAFLVIPNNSVTVQYIYSDSRLLSRVFL